MIPRISLLFLGFIAAAAAAPGGLVGQTAAWHLGASVHSGQIPSPFGGGCHARSELPWTAVGGPEIHGSLVRASGVDLTLRLSLLHQMNGGVNCPGSSPDHGTYWWHQYEADVSGQAARAAELSAGYSPPLVPAVRASLGAGWLGGAGRPYGVATVGLRVGTRLRFMADWGFRYAAVPWTVTMIEWQDDVVTREQRFPGATWATGREFRFGLDFQVR